MAKKRKIFRKKIKREETNKGRMTAGLAFGWILGLYGMLWGFFKIFDYPVLGLIGFFAGLIIFPPFSQYTKVHWNFRLSGGMKWSLYILLQIVAGYLMLQLFFQTLVSTTV